MSNEKNFAASIAALAIKLRITPGKAVEIFGELAGMMIQHEVECGRADQGGAQDTCLHLFTNGVVRGLEKAKARR